MIRFQNGATVKIRSRHYFFRKHCLTSILFFVRLGGTSPRKKIISIVGLEWPWYTDFYSFRRNGSSLDGWIPCPGHYWTTRYRQNITCKAFFCKNCRYRVRKTSRNWCHSRTGIKLTISGSKSLHFSSHSIPKEKLSFTYSFIASEVVIRWPHGHSSGVKINFFSILMASKSVGVIPLALSLVTSFMSG